MGKMATFGSIVAVRVFIVNSMYLDIINGHTGFLQKYIYVKIKVPLKVRVFMRFLHCKVIFTKDNSSKRVIRV
jgi:hypothetical protein